MKTITRMLALALALVLCLGLTACGGTETPESSVPAADVSTTTAATEEITTSTEAETTTEATTTEATTAATTTASTKRTKNLQGGITMAETTTTIATTTSAPQNPLRVLSIGHSFSKDAMEAYLWDLLDASGKYDYIVIAYLFYPGCPLNGQWDRIQGKTDPETGAPYEYQQYRKTDPYTGQWQSCYKPDNYKNLAAYAIKDEKWDIITLQPSPDYGPGPEVCKGNNDYANVGNIVNWINSNKTNSSAKIYYHMTWAFAEDCKLWSFMYSNWNQMEMYNNFVNATKKYIFEAHPGKFAGIIPAGTSIQNARSSRLGDVFNEPGGYEEDGKTAKDGYHLNKRGDFVAALTWYSVLTGQSATTASTACPKDYTDDFAIFAEAVDKAIATPYAVTQSSYT